MLLFIVTIYQTDFFLSSRNLLFASLRLFIYTESMSISYVFLLFLCYSFVGWVWETTYCSIKQRQFVNRGFLFGPICPVYGFGGMMIMYLLRPWADTWIPLFFASMFLTSLLEYMTSWGLEVLFHTKWWDYSQRKFNLHGRICLAGAVTFGVMGTLICHFVHPPLEQAILSLPYKTACIVAGSLFTVFIVDIAVTVKGLVDFTEHMAKLKEFAEGFKERYREETWFKEHVHSLSDLFGIVKEKARDGQLHLSESMVRKLEAFSERQHKMTVFMKRFPTMYSKKYTGAVENLRYRVKQEIEQKRAARKNRREQKLR